MSRRRMKAAVPGRCFREEGGFQVSLGRLDARVQDAPAPDSSVRGLGDVLGTISNSTYLGPNGFTTARSDLISYSERATGLSPS